ncbi:ACP5, partial [Symbiodinium necroappetens]
MRFSLLPALFTGAALAAGDSEVPSAEPSTGLDSDIGAGKKRPSRPWYQVYESNVKTVIFYSLSAVVVVGYLGDRYYEHLRRQRKRSREKARPRPTQERSQNQGQQE